MLFRSDVAAQHLIGIARNGPSAGVYILATRNRDIAPPFHCDTKALEDASTVIVTKLPDEFTWNDPTFSAYAILPDRMPPAIQVKDILEKVGKAAQQQGNRGLAFTKIMPPKPWWTRKSNERLTAAIGVSGAGANHEFDVGMGVVHHAMIGGQTGSGKTNLLHVLINNLALTYSPDELEMYLVDFKEGVEFQDYVTFDLPHARAVAIESEREFGLSILHRMQSEMEQRGQVFRTEQVASISEYRRKTGKKMPRVLLIVDEYQILFREDDRLSQEASNVLADLVRRGRSFGIHIVLSSQSPSSTFISNRTVYDQIALRICMQCREADARLILGDDNDEAKTLERPGEAIYNSENGRPDKNTFLRVALFPTSERRQFLDQVRQLGQQSRFKRIEPLAIFQGATPARIQDNRRLWQMLWSPHYAATSTPAFGWLGEAIEIKDHTAAVFERQSLKFAHRRSGGSVRARYVGSRSVEFGRAATAQRRHAFCARSRWQ